MLRLQCFFSHLCKRHTCSPVFVSVESEDKAIPWATLMTDSLLWVTFDPMNCIDIT